MAAESSSSKLIISAARRELLRWFDRAKRDLPWRRTADPYGIWVSEVMLQQTQVDRVKAYWTRFMQALPTVQALAEAELPEVLSLWRGLGYYSRARNLHRAAQQVVAEHGGRLPAELEALRALPGFGRYTAGAVASIAFGLPAPIVDGNVARVLSRLFELDGVPGEPAREAQLWALASKLVVGARPGDLNQSLMELGALICLPSSPTCLLCPLRPRCGALRSGRVDELPPARPRAARKSLLVAVAVVRQPGAVLLARRAESGLFGGLWELPSVEIARRLAAGAALQRLLGARAHVGRHLGVVERTLTHRDLRFEVFEVKGSAAPALEGYQEVAYRAPDSIGQLGVSSAMQAVLELALGASEAKTTGPKAAAKRPRPRAAPRTGRRAPTPR